MGCDKKGGQALRMTAFLFSFFYGYQSATFLLSKMYEIKPKMTKNAHPPRMLLLFTFPVKEQAIRITAAAKININPRFFNKPFMCVFLLDYYILYAFLLTKESIIL